MPTPTQNIANVMGAYSRAATGVAPGLEARDKPSANGDEFADLVKGALDEARKIGERSEQLSISGIRDNADLNQVITAVAEAEVTLQTVVSIRDKVIEAYKEISRMPM